jgi:hypothetical protein
LAKSAEINQVTYRQRSQFELLSSSIPKIDKADAHPIGYRLVCASLDDAEGGETFPASSECPPRPAGGAHCVR